MSFHSVPFGGFIAVLAIFKSFSGENECLPFPHSDFCFHYDNKAFLITTSNKTKSLILVPLPRIDFKMFISKLFSKCFASSKSFGNSLPTEVWIHIWSFLDFNTLQEICTLVSKKWLHEIRYSTRLSGEMMLRLSNQDVKDINDVLSRWPKLKVLHLSDCNCNYRRCNCNGSQLCKVVSLWEESEVFPLTTEMLGINLTELRLLRKIIVPKSMPVLELGELGKATKVWFDPKNWTPANFENVIDLRLYVNSVSKCREIMKNGQFLINVEEMYICPKEGPVGVKLDSEFILGFRNFILGMKSLTEVTIEVDVGITDFLDFLHAIANVKDVKFWLNVCILHDHLEKDYVKGVFEDGFKIVAKTFPIESTDVGISDAEYEFKIDKKYHKEPKLYEGSDFESSEDEESTENDDNSSVENFEDFDERSNLGSNRIVQFINFLCSPILRLKNKLIDNLNC